MREIKFRAWNKVGHYITPSFSIWKINLFGDPNASDWELNQYTGLKDKNGKEGYFGDLVKWGKGIYKVVWNEDDGIAALQYVSGREVFKYLRISQIKKGVIIGNIYENPKLLNAE